MQNDVWAASFLIIGRTVEECLAQSSQPTCTQGRVEQGPVRERFTASVLPATGSDLTFSALLCLSMEGHDVLVPVTFAAVWLRL